MAACVHRQVMKTGLLKILSQGQIARCLSSSTERLLVSLDDKTGQ